MSTAKVLGEVIPVGDTEKKLIKELRTDAFSPKYGKKLTDWEREFLDDIYVGSLRDSVTWTPKQHDVIKRLEIKLYQ